MYKKLYHLHFVVCLVFSLIFILEVQEVNATLNREYKSSYISFQQNNHPEMTITGHVYDNQGPLIGVSVKIKNTTKGVVTDNQGNFQITSPADATLVFSYIGYQQKEVTLNGQIRLNVKLEPETNKLEDVVVVGYRTQKRGEVTGSVTSVNGSQLQNTPYDNLSNALSGRLSGVSVNQSAGTPGMESSIKIRAQGTFNNADPLYVIDGVVSEKFAFDGLSTNEIESVTILKDAASAAIYGSRAANGVVLVTTKRGQQGKPKFSYSGLFGLQNPTTLPKTLNAYQHAKAINDALHYNSVPETDARYYTADELDYFKTHSWDWVQELWKAPSTNQHSLNVSGGNDYVKYFLGGNYNYATGSFNNINYQKFNLRGNVDVNVTSNLKIGLDLNTDKRKTNGPSWDTGNWRQEDLYKALQFRPEMVPPYINGMPVANWVEWHPGVVLDPSKAGYNKREWTGLNYTLSLNYKIPFIKGLSARLAFNKYKLDEYNKQFNLPYEMTIFNTLGQHNHIVGDQVVGMKARSAAEYLQSRYDKLERYQFNAQLNYKNTFGKNNIDALFVYEQAESNDLWFSGRRDNFISSAIDQYVAGSTVNPTVNGSENQSARISYVGLVSYNYANKYLLETSFRYDGSVIFAPENRWGFFPSVSLGWRISDEPFFKDHIHFFNDLKLRASVGMLGNDDVGNFQWLQSYNIVNGAIFGDASYGLQPGSLANRAITWEKSVSYNGGLDSRFLNNTMNFKFDVYYRDTYDILGSRQQSIPSTFGATLPDENYQKINSKGFEVELGYNNHFGNSDHPFTYYLSGNFGYSTNKVVRLDQAENIRAYQSKIGRPINGVFGYVATNILRTQADLDALPAGYTILGQVPRLGMLNYQDIRGPNSDQPDGKITSDDQQYIADYSVPPMTFGFSFGGTWKSFNLDILLQGVAGGKEMMQTNGRDIQARAEESSFAYWADSWTPDNPNGAYPGYRSTSYRTRYPASTFWLQDLSFLRFKNLTLSYNLPRKWLNPLNIQSAKLFFTGSNLFMIYSGNHIYDPEVNNIRAYPIMKTYSFGLNLGL